MLSLRTGHLNIKHSHLAIIAADLFLTYGSLKVRLISIVSVLLSAVDAGMENEA